MRPKLWMLVAWGAILAGLVAIGVFAGAPHCAVPKSGLFHRLLAGRKFVANSRGRIACREVK